jgi:AcrR family transcriptional regulator
VRCVGYGAAVTSSDTPLVRPRQQAYSLDELVAVAAQQFLRRGYDATSMEDLSRATGRAKSSIYHHVSGKEELLRLAVSRALDALFAVLDDAEAREGAAVDRLEEVLRASVRVLVAELGYVTLLLRVRGNTGTERWALSRRREFDRRLTALVEQAVTEGDLRADIEPALVTRLVFGTVNSLVDWLRPGGRHSRQVEDAMVALVLEGLRA